MSVFSDTLNRYHAASKCTTKTLAQAVGEDPSYLTKIKQAKFLPNDPKLISRIAAALCLPPDEQDELVHSYLISQIGKDKYSLLQSAQKLLLSIQDDVIPTADEAVILPVVTALHGKRDVERFLYLLFAQAQKNDDPIDIIGQPTSETLMHALCSSIDSKGKSFITHICCMQQGNLEIAGAQNATCLMSEIPLLLRTKRYRTYHYYDQVAAHCNDRSFLPNLVITGQCAVQIANDYSIAVLHTEKVKIDAFRELFQNQLAMCHPTVCRVNQQDVFTYSVSNYKQQLADDQNGAIYSIEPMACCLLGITEEIVQKELSGCPDNQRQEILKLFSYYSDHLKSLFLKKGDKKSYSYVSIFSESGLRDYIKKGTWPSQSVADLIPSISPENRAAILSNLISMTYEGVFLPVVLKPNKLAFSQRLFCDSVSTAGCSIYYSLYNQYSTLAVQETSIAHALREYMEYLPQSDLVYTREESLRILQEARRECQQSGGSAQETNTQTGII